MASSGESLTYRQLNDRSNQLAQLLAAAGLRPGDHFAIFMENTLQFAECCWAGERSGLYYTCVNSYLTAEEVAYIVDNCEAQVLITSAARRDVALEVAKLVPQVHTFLMVGPHAARPPGGPFPPFQAALAQYP